MGKEMEVLKATNELLTKEINTLKARNRSLTAAAEDTVKFLANDVELSPDNLEEVCTYLGVDVPCLLVTLTVEVPYGTSICSVRGDNGHSIEWEEQ